LILSWTESEPPNTRFANVCILSATPIHLHRVICGRFSCHPNQREDIHQKIAFHMGKREGVPPGVPSCSDVVDAGWLMSDVDVRRCGRDVRSQELSERYRWATEGRPIRFVGSATSLKSLVADTNIKHEPRDGVDDVKSFRSAARKRADVNA